MPVALAAAILATSGRVGAHDVTGSVAEPLFEGLGFSPAVARTLHDGTRKVGHFLAYALFAWLALRALAAGARAGWKDGAAAAGLALFLASCDETMQRLTPDRTPSVADVGIDTAGAVCAVLVTLLLASRRAATAEVRTGPE